MSTDSEFNIKEMLFIYNPKSGRGAVSTHLVEILNIFQSYGYMVKLYRMRVPGDIQYVAEHEGRKVELVVCAGGDGTLNSVITGIMQIEPENRPNIGFIPTGTTNDTRNSYDLPLNILKAAKLTMTGEPFATDIGTCNDRYFTYVASFGELSAVSCYTSQIAKNLLGHTAYLLEGIRALLNMKSHVMKITYDDQVITGDFFLGMVTNATSVGGFNGITGKNVDLQDGLYEVILVRRPLDVIEFGQEIQAMVLDESMQNDVMNDLVVRFSADRITFESEDDVQWVVDGENAGRNQKTTIVNYNKAVNIIAGTALTEKSK